MELIKTPSFNAMDDLCFELAKHNKDFTFEQMQKKVYNYLVKSGSKKFVELYNDFAKNKNYNQAFTTINL